MGQYEGGRGLKWPKIGDVVYGWPLITIPRHVNPKRKRSASIITRISAIQPTRKNAPMKRNKSVKLYTKPKLPMRRNKSVTQLTPKNASPPTTTKRIARKSHTNLANTLHSIEIAKKVFVTFDNVFHAYLIS